MDNSVRKETTVSKVAVDSVYTSPEFQKEGTKTAQLRQVIITRSWYPSKQISTDLQDNIFSLEEFGFEEQEFESEENRVAWIDIPESISDPVDVLAKIPADSCLYKIMSNRPILSSSQSYAIKEGLTTLDNFANTQVVRYGKGNPDEGKLILDTNKKPQYRAIFFSASPKDDIDRRTDTGDDFYVSAEISAEMTGNASVAPSQMLKSTPVE